MTDVTGTGSFWEGKLVRLRPQRPEDFDVWLEESTDDETVRFLEYTIELPKSGKAKKAAAERCSEFNQAPGRIEFAIETLAGEFVGVICIGAINQKNGTFSTVTRIYRKHRGHGYALEAKRIVLKYCFEELRLQKYNNQCIETNAGIQEHLKRLGCKEEGRIRRNIYTNGRFYDELHFGLTKEEFEENEKRLAQEAQRAIQRKPTRGKAKRR